MVSVSTHFLVLQFPDNSKEGFGSQCTWFPEPASCRPVSGFILVVGFQPKLSAFKKKKRRTLQYAWDKCYSYSLDTNPWDSCYHQRQDHSGDPVTWLPLGLWVLCIPQLACTCGDLGADWQPWGCRAWPCLWLVRGWARRQPTFPPCSWLAWTCWWQIRSWCKLSGQMSTPIPMCEAASSLGLQGSDLPSNDDFYSFILCLINTKEVGAVQFVLGKPQNGFI